MTKFSSALVCIPVSNYKDNAFLASASSADLVRSHVGALPADCKHHKEKQSYSDQLSESEQD